jgi:aryl-alcohol dehydrogenase-like predicted oxidoreductase
METRALGRTGFQATVLSYGAMEIRGPRIWGGRDVTDEQAERILDAVLDGGINLIDTSYDYGRSERWPRVRICFVGSKSSRFGGCPPIILRRGC